MKTLVVLAILLTSMGPGWGAEPEKPTSNLVSLHGTMITMISDHEGMPMEIWAKGNNVRSEISAGDQKLIIIQRGDTLYT
jgi:hypothetical protein